MALRCNSTHTNSCSIMDTQTASVNYVEYASKDYLQNALDQISSRMTASLLTLNSSKTQFLVISLSKTIGKNPQLLT